MVNSCKISKKRASSVMSRTSEGGVDGSIGKTLGGSGRDSIGTPTHLSRGGSLQNKAHTSLVKQDSTASGFSQGSQSSGNYNNFFLFRYICLCSRTSLKIWQVFTF